MTKQAISRRSDVVTRVEGDETLVLDTQSNAAHCLSGDVAAVWNAAGTSVADVAAATGLPAEAVETAARALGDLGLVLAPTGLTRRSLVTHGAVVGGAVVAAGAITVGLPSAAMAASSDTFTVTGTCAGDFATFSIQPIGSKGVLASKHPYKGTLVYESWNGTDITYWTVTFNVQTNGAKVQTGSVTPGGTDTGATVSVSPAGSNGTITVVTTKPFASATPTLPGNLYDAVPPTGHGFGAGALNGGSSGNVYLQFVPTIPGDAPWAGYFSLTGCVTITGNPPVSWPAPTT
jgi:hypothetical protein